MMRRVTVDLLRGIFWLCVLIAGLCCWCYVADAAPADDVQAARVLGGIAELVLHKADLPCPEGVRLVSVVPGADDFTIKVVCGPFGDFRYTYVIHSVREGTYTVQWAGQ